MLPRWHVLFGFVIAYILVYFFNFSLLAGLIIFIASWLIDIDHYFYHVYKQRDFSLKRAYNWFIMKREKHKKLLKHKRKLHKNHILLFHGFEFFLIITFLAYFSPLFLWMLIGVFIHMLADYAELIYHYHPIDSKLSQIYTYIKNKNKKELI
ncbi:MAG: hypothetical protein ACP5D2_02600 [Candidatus Nanoarchaeia archaeon]